jgi:hypothetical protein
MLTRKRFSSPMKKRLLLLLKHCPNGNRSLNFLIKRSLFSRKRRKRRITENGRRCLHTPDMTCIMMTIS